MHGDIFARTAAVRDELAQHQFASDLAGNVAPETAQLAADENAHLDQRDYHLAHASKTRHHDERPFEGKAGIPDLQQGQGGNGGGSGGGFCNCKSPAERAYCFTHGTCNPPGGPGGGGKGGGGSGGGTSGGGGGGPVSGGGPPSWFKQWQRNQPRGGGGGGGLLGPNALGGLKLLPNVPIGAAGTGAPATGPSPVLVVGLLAIAGVGGYFLWHKLRMARHEDKQLDKGEEAKDAA